MDEYEEMISDFDVEAAGFDDGSIDKDMHLPTYSSYGSSIDVNKLTDEQRDLYENAYFSGEEDFSDEDF
jgi:hypothetical protein